MKIRLCRAIKFVICVNYDQNLFSLTKSVERDAKESFRGKMAAQNLGTRRYMYAPPDFAGPFLAKRGAARSLSFAKSILLLKHG